MGVQLQIGTNLDSISVSQLSRRLNKINPDIFQQLFLNLVVQIQMKTNYIKEHERGQLEVIVDDKECVYLFDRGYLDYERFNRMTNEGFFFLTGLKKNAVIRDIYDFKILADSDVLSDLMVLIGTTTNRAENYF